MRVFLSFLLIVLLFLVLFLLATAALLAWAIFLGWLLTKIGGLDFNLFEGSLLALIASITVGVIAYRIANARVPSFSEDEEDEEEFEDEDEDYPIPFGRFAKTEEEKTYEAWYRYEVANGIFGEIRDAPQVGSVMGEPQIQELAVRLADISVAALKRKQRYGAAVSVTIKAMQAEMEKMEQRPYDEDILRAAVRAINEELAYDP